MWSSDGGGELRLYKSLGVALVAPGATTIHSILQHALKMAVFYHIVKSFY